MRRYLLVLFSLGFMGGCANDSSSVSIAPIDGADASRNVTQGGAQDIGEFRRTLEAGQVPPLETLSEVGFFAEHAIDLPPAECDASVCSHPMLAVAPRFDQGNWTMGFIGLNTPLDPEDVPETPRHLLILSDGSAYGELPTDLFSTIAESMREQDRASTIHATETGIELQGGLTASELADTVVPGGYLVPDDSADEGADESEPSSFDSSVTDAESLDGSQLVSGLLQAEWLSGAQEFDGYAQRLLVFTEGAPAADQTTIEVGEEIAHHLAEREVGSSVFGVGEDYDRKLPLALAGAGAGSSYVTTSASDLLDAVSAEAATGFVPLAHDLTIQFEVSDGYEIGDVYGARRAEIDATTATLSSPVLFMGAREGSESAPAGRRGGGGGWFVQLEALSEPGAAPEEEVPVVTVEVSYVDAQSGEHVVQTTTLDSPLGTGNNPPPEDPYFSDEKRAKPFMMLNMYMALYGVVSYYEQGSCSWALGMQDMMGASYELWQQVYDDADIEDDFQLLTDLTQAIRDNGCSEKEPDWPVAAETGCFFF